MLFALVVLFFVSFGVLGLFSPETVHELTGTEGATAVARNEARAVYGGIGLGGAVLLISSLSMIQGETVQWTVGVLLLAMAMCRFLGMAGDWPKAALPVVWLVLEVLGAWVLIG